jgi:hypothetical protein
VNPPLLVATYSARNADRVVSVIEPARRAGWKIALRALDDPHPALADVTRGRGPGLRLANLNQLIAEAGGLPRWVVLCDDDVEFVRGDVVRLVAECEVAGFGLAQPAHAPGSHVSQSHTRVMPRSRSRSVPYVEAGPISVISPEWSGRVLPLPAWRGMGWGLELEWMDLAAEGCILGVVDRVTYLHLDPIGRTYDEDEERARMAADLTVRGIDDLTRMQVTLATWRPWQRRPPWGSR